MSSKFSQIKNIKNLLKNLFDFRYFVLTGFIIFLIIIGIAFFLVYQNAREMSVQINDNFNQQQLILARQAATQINKTLNDIRVEVESLKKLIAMNSKAVQREYIKTIFELLQFKGLIEIGLIDPKGLIVDYYHVNSFKQIDPQKIKINCNLDNSDKMILGQLHVEHEDKEKPIVTAMFCTDIPFDNVSNGLLFIKLDISRIVKDVVWNIRSGKTGYAWVIDETGRFLYHPDEMFIGRNAFTARKKRKPYISYTQINQIMRKRMLNGEEGTGTYVSGWHRGIEGEITKLIAFTPMRNPLFPSDRVWSVAVVAPISEVAEVVHWMYMRHFEAEVALIAGVFVFGLLVFFYQQRVSRALKQRVYQQKIYLSNILQSSVDAIIFIDNENRVQAWNKGAEMIFGYTAKEMIGQTFHRLIPPELDADKELQHIQQEVNNKGYIRNYFAPRVTKEGRRITIDLSRTLVRSEEGEIIGSVAIIKDATEKMELEQRIYNTEKLASIGTLAAGVAHEINNPISVILGFTDLLLEKFEPDSPEYKDLKIIEENGNHAKKVVENLLGFARITEGLEDTVDINHSIDTVINIVKNTLMTKKIDLVVQVEENLPRVQGDTREFQQVIFNLINNSVSAMSEKGGKLKISAWANSDWVHLSVADTGIGIPDKIKPRVFDPFFTTKKIGEGTGLGLSLCYGIVKKYGGKIDFKSISVEDNIDKPPGTTFTVSMPIHKPKDEGERP